MAIYVTIRPAKRTTVTGLPWLGSARAGYQCIEDAIGASRRGQVLYHSGEFSVSRPHTASLISALAERFGEVTVTQYGGIEKCVEACWNASPRTAITCECSCAGGNHGTRQPWGRVVPESGGAGGALAVRSLGRRVYFVRG